MTSEDLVLRSASEQARAVASGEVDEVDLMEATLARLTAVDAVVHGVAHLDRDAALAAAREAADRRRQGVPLGPLHGVPCTIKDWIDVAGMPCSGGERAFLGRRPGRDASVVARLRRAGALVMAKTTVGERSDAFGPTFNPHDLARTPTGSSSGEAALVAAAASAFGLGSDSGGSLRQPAHACGVVTIRPSTGLVPLTGHFPVITPLLDPRTAIGPLTRRVADAAIVLALIAGPDGEDASALPLPLGDRRAVRLEGMRIAWWAEQPDCRPTPETVATVERAAAALAAAGAEIVPDRPEGLETVYPITRTYWSLPESEDAEVWRPTATSSARADEVQRFRFEWEVLRRQLARFFARYDAVLTPAAERPAVLHGEDAGSIAPTLTFSLGGQPAVVVPFGRSPEGLPIGVQVVAGVGHDHVALALGEALERAGGGWWLPAATPAATATLQRSRPSSVSSRP
jgi:amidase